MKVAGTNLRVWLATQLCLLGRKFKWVRDPYWFHELIPSFCNAHMLTWLPGNWPSELNSQLWQTLKSELFLVSWHDAVLTGCDITSDSPVWQMGSHAVKWATDCQAAGQLERVLGQKGVQWKKNIHKRTFTSNYQNTGLKLLITEIMYLLHVLQFCDHTCIWLW